MWRGGIETRVPGALDLSSHLHFPLPFSTRSALFCGLVYMYLKVTWTNGAQAKNYKNLLYYPLWIHCFTMLLLELKTSFTLKFIRRKERGNTSSTLEVRKVSSGCNSIPPWIHLWKDKKAFWFIKKVQLRSHFWIQYTHPFSTIVFLIEQQVQFQILPFSLT